MSVPSDARIDAEQFAQYVSELRQFSDSHHLPCGAQQHLPSLLDRLNESPDFRAQCTSMLRSVFYRQHGATTPEDLLMLLVVAWGGEPTGPPTPALQATITHLLRFAAAVMRTPVLPPELEAEAPPATALPPSALPAQLPPLAAPPLVPPATSPALPALFNPPPVPQRDHQPPVSPELERIESAIHLLAIRSPDVKHYLELLRYREVQLAADQRRGAEPPPVRPHIPTRPTPPAAPPPRRESPWDDNSEFQLQLRRFAAERDARMAAHENPPKAPATLDRTEDLAESTWNRLLGRLRHPRPVH